MERVNPKIFGLARVDSPKQQQIVCQIDSGQPENFRVEIEEKLTRSVADGGRFSLRFDIFDKPQQGVACTVPHVGPTVYALLTMASRMFVRSRLVFLI